MISYGESQHITCHDNSKYLEKVSVTQQEQVNAAQLTWNSHFSKKITCLLLRSTQYVAQLMVLPTKTSGGATQAI